MKSNISSAILLAASCGVAHALETRLLSYNIRWAVDIPGVNELPWSLRRPMLVSQLQRETTDRANSLLCFQEAIASQVTDIQGGLGDAWTYFGVGRDDGADGGEFSPIFYRPDSWLLQESATYWLSQTPEVVGSVGWDAALPRIVTVARFLAADSREPLVFMCTHFDHRGQQARENSAQLIIDIADEWGSLGDPVFVGGDFNSDPQNPAYQILSSGLNDVRDVVPDDLQSGPLMTYTAFTDNRCDDTQIDHLFVRHPAGLEWNGFSTLENQLNGSFISDHRAVVLDVSI
ncbi:hypothetical protein S40288_08429 [Stachybotrys chartarum IBT 40288]|nr:hypothetical protein S40288_08429 [Stachybotrys chartarum IBT 40288]